MRKFSTLNTEIFRYVLMVSFLSTYSIIYSQEYSISGRTLNESGKKMATRLVLYNSDKKLIETIKTSNNGKFKFKNILNGGYLINIYGDNGYSGTENVSVNNSDLNNLEFKLEVVEVQPQLAIKATSDGVEINWRQLSDILEYVIYRDNNEIDRVTNTNYLDKVSPWKNLCL